MRDPNDDPPDDEFDELADANVMDAVEDEVRPYDDGMTTNKPYNERPPDEWTINAAQRILKFGAKFTNTRGPRGQVWKHVSGAIRFIM